MPPGAEPEPPRPRPTPRTASKKRKRAQKIPSGDPSDDQRLPPTKQPRTGAGRPSLQSPGAVKHALLARFYPALPTLRQYVLDHLPASSRIRRRKIIAVGAADGPGADPKDVRTQLARLLNTTLVGLHATPKGVAKEQSEDRLQQWIDYSQRDNSHVTLSGADASAVHFQSEIVDFIIWLLFSREKSPGKRPHHLLCDGFRKNAGPRAQAAPSSIQGLYSLYFNERVAIMKQAPWPRLLQLFGKSGESMMINLLLDGSIFLPVEAGQGNYYQLSGTPIFERDPISSPVTPDSTMDVSAFERKPTEIVFVRSRMLYARAALNARGQVHFGFRHIHALNRFPLHPGGSSKSVGDGGHNAKDPLRNENTLRIMMYIFPRQFGLHNAFTSHVDPFKTAQKFQDYTLREDEIFAKFRRAGKGATQHLDAPVPKRLRGQLEGMVQRLQTLHARCSYAKLLEHYCPIIHPASEERSNSQSTSAKTAPTSNANKLSGKLPKKRKRSRPLLSGPAPRSGSHFSLMECAVPVSNISAFCQAVLSSIIPNPFWGLKDDVQNHNRATFLRHVDRFIKLRRFETISLHEVMQGMKITEIDWLEPPGLKGKKCSQTDFRKRSQILADFVYYVFDSLLIPLVRSNFYVTESNVHRYRLFYFRHDVWRSIAEPAMAELKVKMFEEVNVDDALRILDSRQLGYSQIRLLPKRTSVRPIMNLRRRMITSKDKKVLGQSINSILGPVYNMFKLEKNLHASRLGSTMSSVGDLYEHISGFKQRLGPNHEQFYFAKVDVQAAFNTIPQEAVIALMNSVPSQSKYEMIKHVEVAPNDSSTLAGSKIHKRWHSSAKVAGAAITFLEMLAQQTGPSKKNAIFVDSIYRKTHGTRDLLALMSLHIRQNLVKIGKKYFRQKNGIPQGSIISSVLCNYFYADLERTHLGFLKSDDCLLLRLIDDFLLITTNKAKASRFVTVMQSGMPEYGVTISPSKTLVNFPLSINGTPVPFIPTASTAFPYCGTQIDTYTLEFTKDRGLTPTSAPKDPTVSNTLTVEFSRHPGANFKRKTLNAFKIQSHLMFYDSKHNTSATALRNLSEALVETATKAWAYARCLPPAKQPVSKVWTDTVNDLVEVAYLLLTSRARRVRFPGYECKVGKRQVRVLALGAFRRVLGRKQARYGEVLAWLDAEMGKLDVKKGKRCGHEVEMLA